MEVALGALRLEGVVAEAQEALRPHPDKEDRRTRVVREVQALARMPVRANPVLPRRLLR